MSALYILMFIFQGSVLYHWFKNGKLDRSDGGSITEGIGQGRVTKNMEGAPVDDCMVVLDSDAIEMVCSITTTMLSCYFKFLASNFLDFGSVVCQFNPQFSISNLIFSDIPFVTRGGVICGRYIRVKCCWCCASC